MMSVSREVMDEASTHRLFENFFLAADDFCAVQQEHRAALAAGNFKDLFSWQYAREQAFRRLAAILEKIVACGQEEKGEIARVREVMEKLLAEEDVLQELVMARQMKVQEQLAAMRKGKEALHGYNLNKGLGPRPRYLSSRT